MGLDVPTPDPPEVYRESRDEAYAGDGSKRADVQAYLDGTENAWAEGFSEWAAETPLTEDEFRIASELGLVSAFDFAWDAEAGWVTYEAPDVPREWVSSVAYPAIDSWSTASAIEEELDALGETVAGVLTDYYLAWETEEHQVRTFGPQFNGRDDVLTDAQDAAEDAGDTG